MAGKKKWQIHLVPQKITQVLFLQTPYAEVLMYFPCHTYSNIKDHVFKSGEFIKLVIASSRLFLK